MGPVAALCGLLAALVALHGLVHHVAQGLGPGRDVAAPAAVEPGDLVDGEADTERVAQLHAGS